MPRAKWMSDSEFAAFERCLKKVSDVSNKYAVCMAAIKKGHKKSESDKNRKALGRVKSKKR